MLAYIKTQVKAHIRAYEVLSLEPHFDPADLRFRNYEADPITGKTILRLIDVTGPTKDLNSTLRSSKVRTVTCTNICTDIQRYTSFCIDTYTLRLCDTR
jgi:hypothetical protein